MNDVNNYYTRVKPDDGYKLFSPAYNAKTDTAKITRLVSKMLLEGADVKIYHCGLMLYIFRKASECAQYVTAMPEGYKRATTVATTLHWAEVERIHAQLLARDKDAKILRTGMKLWVIKKDEGSGNTKNINDAGARFANRITERGTANRLKERRKKKA